MSWPQCVTHVLAPDLDRHRNLNLNPDLDPSRLDRHWH